MEKLLIEGGSRLCGEVFVHGAKNAALPIISAALLGKKSVIHNCPHLLDIAAAADILRKLGCEVSHDEAILTVDACNAEYSEPPERLMREMRSSILFLGAMLARFKKARVSFPGGCELGARPVDMHIDGLRRLGAIIEEDYGFLNCRVEGRLRGTLISLAFPSVGATENIMIAAASAEGTTVIKNAAREPEIADLASFLNGCGANISVNGDEIIIDGVEKFSDCEHSVIPDRIESATYLCAAAATQGEIVLNNVCPNHLSAMLPIFEEAGCTIKTFGSTVCFKAPKRLSAVRMIKTMPYPGFPTDAQAPFMAALCTAFGTGVIVENIFEARYKHVGELLRMGARISIADRVAVIEGVPSLHSAHVKCTDLRGGAALIIAALAAKGESVITELRHIDRGYYNFEAGLRSLGAKIRREGENAGET